MHGSAPGSESHVAATRRKPRTWLRRTIWTIVIVAAVFYVGGGWYFSGVIHDRALSGEERRASRDFDPDLTVQAVTDDTIVLRPDDPDDAPVELGEDWRYGLRWSTGHGEVGEVLSTDGADVARTFTVVEGEPPGVGDAAELDVVVFADPIEAGVRVEEVGIAGPLGDYPAWLDDARRDTWVILVHGNSMSRTDSLRWLPSLADAGYPTLTITYRNDEGAPEDPSGLLRYGESEWLDLESAVQFALNEGAEDVVLFGTSMGGGIVESFLARSELADRTAAVVLDAPMLDFSETVDDNAAREPLVGPINVPPSLTWVAKQITSFRDDVEWKELNYIADGGLGDVPTLIFHGTDDLTVPIATSREAFEVFPETVTLIECPGVDHIACWNADPDAADADVLDFLAQALGNQG